MPQIVKYFFRHQVSDEIASKVQDRLVHTSHDLDPVLRELWDECEEGTADDASTETAYQRLLSSLPGSSGSGRLPWLKIAAIWIVPFTLMGLAAFFYASGLKQSRSLSEVVFMHQFTAYGERCMVTLPDSSRVWLNGGSSLIYPSRFVSAERNVCLTGEAFFEVTKDASRPFTVDVNQMKLKVLGTTFNVFSYPDNPKVVATLETGKIEISVANQKKPYVLSPDNQLVLDTKTGEVEVHDVRAADFSVWRIPALHFDEVELMYAFQQIARTYDVKIHIQNSRYNHQTIRAHFNAGESIEGIMAVIKMLIPSLNYEIDGNDIFIR